MRLFIDTEFNEYRGALISMALVAEDGRYWYGVRFCDDPGYWVAEHVMPILKAEPRRDSDLRESLQEFLTSFPACHIVADWPEDIAHFCTFIINGPGKRIKTPPLTFEILEIEAPSDLPHNALMDAKGIMEAVLDSGR